MSLLMPDGAISTLHRVFELPDHRVSLEHHELPETFDDLVAHGPPP